MLKGIWLLPVMAWSGAAFAQQPPEPTPPPVEKSPVVTTCPKTDALCIMAERLKKKDPGIGSRSGMAPGYVAKQPPPGTVIPGGRIDEQFIKGFKEYKT